MSDRHRDPNTAYKIRGCFIGIPGSRDPKLVQRDDVHLLEVAADLYRIGNHWWKGNSEIALSDCSVWGKLNVRQSCVANPSL